MAFALGTRSSFSYLPFSIFFYYGLYCTGTIEGGGNFNIGRKRLSNVRHNEGCFDAVKRDYILIEQFCHCDKKNTALIANNII